MTDPSDPAANTRHAAQETVSIDERWSAMSNSAAHDEDAFNAMIMDIMGEAPSYEGGTRPDPSSDHRREIFQEYLDQIPAIHRVVIVHHYGIWGTKQSPAETADALNISPAQYDDYLVAAKAELKTRKNELFKEIALDVS